MGSDDGIDVNEKNIDIKYEVEPGAWEEGNVELSVAQAQ